MRIGPIHISAMPQTAAGKPAGERCESVTPSRLPAPEELLKKLTRGEVGPEEIQQAREVLPGTTDRATMLQLSRYVLSVKPETYDEILGVHRNHPEQQKLADTIHSWGSGLDAENRKLLMMFLMAAEPEKAETSEGRVELLRLGIFCGTAETQRTLGARVAEELLRLDLTADQLLHQTRINLSPWAALGGAPSVLKAVAERVEHPVLQERLQPFEERAQRCQGMEAHELLAGAQEVIELFRAHEAQARALVEPPETSMVLERGEMILVGGTVLRRSGQRTG